ncbi:MAG: PQQ-like beta-propeller repeat protein [Opitutaceae bacterium]|nr:PQQ-like beta-propeller repeat protein [Opitutaceae bacterium]
MQILPSLVIGGLIVANLLPSKAHASENATQFDWPAWRGPDQNNISPDTDLLKSWPKNGPELLWTYENAGSGYSSTAIVDGKLYTLGSRDRRELVICLDANTGEEIWTAEFETDPEEGYRTQWGAGPRSTPTVSDGHVYALGVAGDIVCLTSDKGKRIWSKNLVKNFGGAVSKWGYSESPTVDGDKVLVTPGGSKGAIVALNKKTGAKLWQSKKLKDAAEYSAVVVADNAGHRQYIQLFMNTLAGVDAATGNLLWKSDWPQGRTAVIPTPIYRDGHVFMTSGYRAGSKLVKVDGKKTEVVWENQEMINHHGGVVLIGDHVYGFSDQKKGNLMCLEFMTGKVAWMERVERELHKGTVHAADGMLYCLNENEGWVYLVEANPLGFREKGKFQLPKETTLRDENNGKVWSHPVVINGKLYLRDQDLIFCYNVKG